MADLCRFPLLSVLHTWWLRLFFTAVATVICCNINAQGLFRKTETRTSGIAVNMHWMQMADQFFSPMSYSGPGIDIRVVSARSYQDVRRHFQIGGRVDYLRNSLQFSAGYIHPSANWGLSSMVNGLSTDRGLSYIGGNISGGSRMYKFLNEDSDRIYWSTSYTADFYYYFDYEIDRDRKFIAELIVPVAGVISRPAGGNHYTFQMPGFAEYVKRVHENIGFATFDKMQSVNLRLVADISKTRLRSFNVGYEIDFTRFAEPEPVVYFTNSVFFRILFNAFVW